MDNPELRSRYPLCAAMYDRQKQAIGEEHAGYLEFWMLAYFLERGEDFSPDSFEWGFSALDRAALKARISLL